MDDIGKRIKDFFSDADFGVGAMNLIGMAKDRVLGFIDDIFGLRTDALKALGKPDTAVAAAEEERQKFKESFGSIFENAAEKAAAEARRLAKSHGIGGGTAVASAPPPAALPGAPAAGGPAPARTPTA
jgi:hypothetical protein